MSHMEIKIHGGTVMFTPVPDYRSDEAMFDVREDIGSSVCMNITKRQAAELRDALTAWLESS